MSVLEASRDIKDYSKIPPLLTEEKREKQFRPLSVGGSIQDNSITVTENPSVSGDISYLFAEHFSESPISRSLRNVLHFRFEASTLKLINLEEHERVDIQSGYDPVGKFQYEFLTPGDGQLALPRPSILPYEIGFLDPYEYQYFRAGLRLDETTRDTVSQINLWLSQSIKTFDLAPSLALILPKNYAALSLKDLAH